MYLSIGSDDIVKKDDIIGIFDLDNTTVSKRTRILLSEMQKAGLVRDASDGNLPKSMILCSSGGKSVLWLSQYAPKTLYKRFYSDGIIG